MATENKNLSQYDKNSLPNIQNKKFGIVISEWNYSITENMRKGALDTLLDCGASLDNIHQWYVPGSFELVNGAKQMLDRFSLDAIIVIGCVIQGETKHFDFVCQGVTQGIAQLNTMQSTPVIFCVLTDNTIEQSIARSGGKHGNKGVEAAIAAIKMTSL
ncbi:6,7-dimethyl-8-ribityllumazine synthase [Capnocytophaga catalasegens]|uniref:6,7-dimethyl-8-ribityllumazine synthase n=1 Tax=Capnocytophaga catalasegens TaxID=1004260 RepID=A0AAV5AQ52_9FLAO|nr:6,7-dimethyl-8-ribityllumazine synthase [Capnocytophaga catalasegens]GIZ15012.1 6,7-dimethyl-8-ribityllumazine synthase [Capnocytophaga catalasegens]GJM49392.1 6,7-dimethyl-8-ribityllumazine synthase [Capnocytophaga catalasegens]GJM52542.1 6,7-dimethyl-8-ribityllumazine synthase [Capnocytophaga catalasegens]